VFSGFRSSIGRDIAGEESGWLGRSVARETQERNFDTNEEPYMPPSRFSTRVRGLHPPFPVAVASSSAWARASAPKMTARLDFLEPDLDFLESPLDLDFLEPDLDLDFLESPLDLDFLEPDLDFDFLEPDFDFDFLEPDLDFDFLEPDLDFDFLEPDLDFDFLEPDLDFDVRARFRVNDPSPFSSTDSGAPRKVPLVNRSLASMHAKEVRASKKVNKKNVVFIEMWLVSFF